MKDLPEKSAPSKIGETTNAGSSETNSEKPYLFQAGNPYRFQPGQSGNPSGRPKKKWLTEAFEQMLEQKLADPVERERFINAQWEKMIAGRVVGAMIMDKAWERTEGKVVQPVTVDGELNLTLSDRMSRALSRLDGSNESGS